MTVTIIGAGNMGHAIGTKVLAGGHELTILDKDPAKAQQTADQLGAEIQAGKVGTPLQSDIIILAVPYAAMTDIAEQYQDQLKDKLIVDISNPVDFETFELLTPADSSGAEHIASLMPDGTTVVKAFNTTFAKTLVQGNVDGKPLDVYVASDDSDAAQTIVQLANDGGLRGIHVGPLKRARTLEGLQLMHMAIQDRLGTNGMSAIKILP